MLPLSLTVVFSLTALTSADYFHFPTLADVCPEDDALCVLAVTDTNRNQCYHYDVSQLCCNRCKQLMDKTRAKTCPYGDYSDGVSMDNGDIATCESKITKVKCQEYCYPPHGGRQNCCKSCEEMCGPDPTQSTAQTKRISDLLRVLKNIIQNP